MKTTLQQQAQRLQDVVAGTLSATDFLGLLPKDAQRLAEFGVVLLQRGDCDAAEACGKLATALAPTSFLGWLVLGAASGQLGREASALVAYQQATKLNPNHLRAWVDLAELYLQRMEYAPAAEALEQVRSRDPEAKSSAAKRAQVLVVNTLMTLDQ